MDPLILQAVGFGFTAGTSPGTLHTILLNVTLTLGWRYGILIAISPLLTDAPIIIVTQLLLAQFPEQLANLIRIIGGLAVLWIAWTSWQQANELRDETPPAADAGAKLTRETLLKGMIVNWLNPAPYIFWTTITGPLLREALSQSVGLAAAFLLGFYGTFIGLMLSFVLIFDRLRGNLSGAVRKGLAQAAVVLLVILGLSLIWSGIQP